MDTSNTSNKPVRRRFIMFGGGVEMLVVLFLLAFLTKSGSSLQSLLFFVTVALAVYYYVRTCFHFGKVVGIVGILLLLIACGSFVAYQYSYHLEHEEFVESLSSYDSVTVQKYAALPSSPIRQVSFDYNVTDDELAEVLAMPQLRLVTHVYINRCLATDESLESIDQVQELEYVFIEADGITDQAIRDFEERHPDVSVIPYGRDWKSSD